MRMMLLQMIKSLPYKDLTCLFVKSRTAVIVNPAAHPLQRSDMPVCQKQDCRNREPGCANSKKHGTAKGLKNRPC